MERYGRLDVFFANAGIVGPGLEDDFANISADDFMNVYKVNTLRYVFSHLKPHP